MKWRSTKAASCGVKSEELAAAWSQERKDCGLLGIEFRSVKLALSGAPTRYVVVAENEYLAERRTLRMYEALAAELGSELDEEDWERITERLDARFAAEDGRS